MGMTQGLLARMVADAAPAELRGTAFGLFHLTLGLTALAGNVAAGFIWTYGGAFWLFGFGALISLLLFLLIALKIGFSKPR
jgi:hypothetical protein